MFFEVLESDGVRHAMELFKPIVPKKKEEATKTSVGLVCYGNVPFITRKMTPSYR
jgi:hypothetical protein